LALLVIAMFASALLGQDRPPSKFDIFTGYSWLHPGYDTYVPNAQENIDKGFTVSGTYFFNRNFGMGIDYGNDRGCCCPQIYTLTAGPTVRFPVGRVTPFVHGLAGLHRMDLPSPFGNDTNWGIIAGAGVDVRLVHHVSLRLVQADYEYAQHSYGLLQPTLSGVRLSTGLVWQFGEVGKPPVFPAVATCSVQPTAVFAGEPVTATAIGSGFNPKRTIVYSWSGNGVKVSGSSASTQIDTAGLAPGSYQVMANLNDGSREGVASCNARFVVSQPNPPSISCSPNPDSVPTGGPSTISSIASSPDGRSLTYSYATSAGSITGNTSTATLDSTGAQPGTITVTCNVADDRNPPLAASSTTTVNVQSPAPPPPTAEFIAREKRLALHSIYFATAKPTREHPDGGLLPSQETTLVTLASDFQIYLQSKPDARLTLEGHTDPRASVEYNQALSERRVERTKRFLVEQGVPEAAIRTKAYGKEQNLTDAQIRDAVERNPELSTEARERLLDNMKTIILASNRRVDITLSDAGQMSQESVREYPFNAADSLSLLDTHETGKPAKKKNTK
jgi:outer membrane protein OmpA-like peptidoglycan-associated protein